MATVKIICKCVGCGNKREVEAGEVADNDVPMCEKCFMPMIAEKAVIKGRVASDGWGNPESYR